MPEDRGNAPQRPARLDDRQFLAVVEHAPLVSLDIVVRDPSGRVLLGFRENEPARHWWFVPGGRIAKNESLDDAFQRITRDELGRTFDRAAAAFLGVYEHFYTAQPGGLTGSGTHYVALGYEVTASERLSPPREQHSRYDWFTVADLLAAKDVHPNTKKFFDGQPPP